MMTADNVIALLRQASGQSSDARIRGPFDTLMGQMAAHLVGEPLADGEISEAEWALLKRSLRQLSVSPRGVPAWASLQQYAHVLEAALISAAQPESATVFTGDEADSPRRGFGGLSALKAAWSRALHRSRTSAPAAPEPEAPALAAAHLPTITPIAPARRRVHTHTATPTTIIHGNQTNLDMVVGPIKNGTVTIIGIDHAGGGRSPQPAAEEPAFPEDRTGPVSLPPVNTTERKCDVFLSYSRRDGAQMRRLRGDLIAAGFEVWTDDSLKPGTPSWLHAIEEAIEMCLCVVVLLSPDSKRSEWVEKELVTARNYQKQIIPLLLSGDAKSAIPIILANAQFADVTDEAKYRATMARLLPIITQLKRGASTPAVAAR